MMCVFYFTGVSCSTFFKHRDNPPEEPCKEQRLGDINKAVKKQETKN